MSCSPTVFSASCFAGYVSQGQYRKQYHAQMFHEIKYSKLDECRSSDVHYEVSKLIYRSILYIRVATTGRMALEALSVPQDP